MATSKKTNNVLIVGGTIIGLGILCKKGIIPTVKIPLPFGLYFNLCGIFDPPSLVDFGDTLFGDGSGGDPRAKVVDKLNKLAGNGAISIDGNVSVGSGISIPEKILRLGTRLQSIGCADPLGKAAPAGSYLGTVKDIKVDSTKKELRYLVTSGPFVYKPYTHAWISWKCVQDPDTEIAL